jgi:SAM-dependent methyltransferase
VSRSSSAAAFDAVAARYDAITAADANPVIAAQRRVVHDALARHFAAGSRLLEIGCGTGEDTLALTARGHRIVACDPAAAMLSEAGRKLAAAGRADRVRLVPGGVPELAARWRSLAAAVDGVFSNFAPLNCELSLAPLRGLLDQALPVGGRFVAVVLPRWAPLEIACFLAAGQPRVALRRFGRAPVADVEGQRFPIRYYGAADFDRALGAGYRRVETRSLGLVLPPPRFGAAALRVPTLWSLLLALEARLSALPGLRNVGDHLLLVYERAR